MSFYKVILGFGDRMHMIVFFFSLPIRSQGRYFPFPVLTVGMQAHCSAKRKKKKNNAWNTTSVRTCQDCSPELKNTSVIRKSKTRITREIIAAERTSYLGESCVSVPFPQLTDKEMAYLKQ